MKKREILRLLTGTMAGVTAVLATLATPAVGNLVPDKWAFVVAGLTTALLALKEVAVVVGDYLDDGKRNNSFKA